jgi:hypothetical protein
VKKGLKICVKIIGKQYSQIKKKNNTKHIKSLSLFYFNIIYFIIYYIVMLIK